MKITVTENAIKKLKGETLKKENVGFRIMIRGIGWGGPVFEIVQAEQYENDYIEIIEGIKFLVSQDFIEKFGGFDVEYSNFILTRGFYIRALRYGSKC